MTRNLPFALIIAAAISAVAVPTDAAEDPAVPKKKTYPLPLLQTIVSDGVPHEITVNGFPLDGLRSVTDPQGKLLDGFATPMQRYRVLHPYFLRAQDNRIAATCHLNLSHVTDEDPGPWRLDLRAAVVDWPGPLTDSQREYRERELGRAVSPDLVRADADVVKTVTGTFAWAQPLPTWSWTTANAIEDTEVTKTSLYSAYQKLYGELTALRTAHPAATLVAAPGEEALAAGWRTSMREFIQASELRGVKYTLSDELAYAAAHFSRRDFDREQAENAARVAKLPPKTPAQLEAERQERIKKELEELNNPSTDTPTGRDPEPGPDGSMPPRLGLRPLPALAATKLTLLGDGTIARLTIADNDDPMIQFFSNYADGPWGSVGSTKLEADVWFRGDAAGHWVVDAMWPETSAVEKWGTLDDVLDGLRY